MVTFWHVLATLAARLLLWCVRHPDRVEQGLADAHTLVDVVHEAKSKG